MFRLSTLLVVLLLAGCSHHSTSKTPSPVVVSPVKQVRYLESFNRINISGNINVNLHSGYSKPKVVLKGSASDLRNLSVKVSGSTLDLSIGKGYPKLGQVTATIYSHQLNRFEYHGTGKIAGLKLQSNLLDLIIDNKGETQLGDKLIIRELNIKGSGDTHITGVRSHNLKMTLGGDARVTLNGVANVSSIDLTDKAKVSFHWVNNKAMRVRAYDNASITLAGIAEKLDLKLCGKARFNGRHLRVDRAFVKTYDNSLAEISAVKRQHTLASDSSDIHFYTIPEMKTDLLAFNGAVLDMRNLDLPYIEEYDLYNKSLPPG